MATRYVKQARSELNPLYADEEAAMQGQLPAIQQLYASLLSGLNLEAQNQTQMLLESAGNRGVMRSTLPVDAQQGFAQTVLQEQSKLGAQKASEIAGIRQQQGELKINKVKDIYDLASTLRGEHLDRLRLKLEKAGFRLDEQRLAENRRQFGMDYQLEQAKMAEDARQFDLELEEQKQRANKPKAPDILGGFASPNKQFDKKFGEYKPGRMNYHRWELAELQLKKYGVTITKQIKKDLAAIYGSKKDWTQFGMTPKQAGIIRKQYGILDPQKKKKVTSGGSKKRSSSSNGPTLSLSW